MVKVGLLSDTHGWLDPKIVEFFKDCNEVWHCGDIGDVAITDALAQRFTLHAVYGNIDGGILRRIFPEKEVWDACISTRGQTGNSGSTRYGPQPVSRLTGNGLRTLN